MRQTVAFMTYTIEIAPINTIPSVTCRLCQLILTYHAPAPETYRWIEQTTADAEVYPSVHCKGETERE